MARPPADPTQRKSVFISVRITPAEGELLKAAAEAAGLPISDYFRANLPKLVSVDQ
jgi:uncharacterized protein (DUF1778 family)